MSIKIYHTKVDQITDWTQSDLNQEINKGNFPGGTVLNDIVLPSDWNDFHTSTELDMFEDNVRASVIIDMNNANYTMTIDEANAAIKLVINSGDGTKILTYPTTSDATVGATQGFVTAFAGNAFYIQSQTGGSTYKLSTDFVYDVVGYISGSTPTSIRASVLGTFVPYTGASTDLNLGANNLQTTGRIEAGNYVQMTVNGSTVDSQIAINNDTRGIFEVHTSSATAGRSAVMYGARSRGTIASPSAVQSGDYLLSIFSVGYDGTDFALAGGIEFIVDGTPGSNDMPTKLVTSLSRDGTQSPVDVLQLQADGLLTGYNNAGVNAGIVNYEHFIRLSADYTLTSTTNAQKMFNSTTNGTLTLPVGTYFFECLLKVSSMSATSGNAGWGFLGAGTAVIGSSAWSVVGNDATTVSTAGTISGSYHETSDVAADILTATTSTAMWAKINGTFRVTTAGTIIPSIALTTAAAAVVEAPSYFKCHRVGSDTVTNVGNWS